MHKSLLSILIALVCTVGALAANPSGSLPVLYINTEGNAPILTKTDYVKATYYLDPKGVEGVEAFGSVDAPLPLQIRGRGNYTWVGFEKKPYRLKLDKKAALLGMNKSKHWALLAHADDNRGFLRNAVGFQLSRMVGLPWTPGDQPVEVMLNGEYIGLYFLTETVRVDSDRVNVFDYDSEKEDFEKANPGETFPWQDEYATGGWLVEIDNYDDEDQIQIYSRENINDRTLRITYDTPSDYITDAHKQWLRNEFTTLDQLIVEGDRDQCKWAEKIDITNAARFFVVQQLMFNGEAYHGSCKMHREKGNDSKWNYGPVWDFGSGFQTDNPNGYFWEANRLYSNHWVETMWQYPAFKEEVARVYNELMTDGNYESIYTFIDNFANRIANAARADYERWSYLGYGNQNVVERANNVKQTLQNSVNNITNNNLLGNMVNPPQPAVEIYLRGEYNGWAANNSSKFSTTDGDVYTLTVSKLTNGFKVASSDWSTIDFGGVTGMQLDTPYVMTAAAGNCTLASSPLTDVTVTFVLSTHTITLSCGDNPPIIDPINPDQAVLYLRGNLNGWAVLDSYKFDTTDGEVYTLTVSKLTDSFKIADDSWGTYNFGGASNMAVNIPYTLVAGSNVNCTLADTELTDVTLTFVLSSKKLTLTQGDTPPVIDPEEPEDYFVYYHDTNNWEQVYVYTFLPEVFGAWPGQVMTLHTQPIATRSAGTNTWRIDMSDVADQLAPGTTGIIFHNNQGGTENQTANFVYQHGAHYNYEGQTTSTPEIAVDHENAPVEYFNLQGIRVDRPQNGIFIRRQGSKISKVVL